MSIIICLVERNKRLYIASDKRAIRNGILDDNFQKVFRIKENLFFAMTGIAEVGLQYLDLLRRNITLSIDELISLLNTTLVPTPTVLTIMLCGQKEDGNFFIWQKNNSGVITEGDIGTSNFAFSIGSNQNINTYNNYLEQQLISGVSIEQSIIKTIQFASDIDSTISRKYDFYKL